MITKLSESSGRFLGYKISGKIGQHEEHLWIFGIEAALEMHAKVCVMLVLDSDAGWGVKAGLEDIKWLLKYMKRLDRVAIVSDEKIWKWLVSVDSVFARFVGIHERYFKVKEIDEAWHWLKDADAKKATA